MVSSMYSHGHNACSKAITLLHTQSLSKGITVMSHTGYFQRSSIHMVCVLRDTSLIELRFEKGGMICL